MPQPLPDLESALTNLNNLRRDGVVLANLAEIARLEKSIESIKATQNGQPASMDMVAGYYVTLAMLRCLSGDFDQVVSLGEKGMRITADPQLIRNQVVSLEVAGFFSKARELFDSRLDDGGLLSLGGAPLNTVALLMNCQSYGKVDEIMDIFAEEFPAQVAAMKAANQILAHLHITEKQVLAMLDIAGEMMRARNVFLAQDLSVSTYAHDKFMTISLPVKLSPSDVAELEWEYLGKLVKQFPDIPFSSFSIGFSCPHDIYA